MNAKKTRRPRAVLPPPRKVNVCDAVSEAISEIQSLAEEMRGWADNMEEKFGQTEKYERVSECADTLENVSEPDLPEGLMEVEVTIQDPKPRARGYSRADRLSQAVTILEMCQQRLEEFKDEDGTSEDHASAAEDLAGEIDNIVSDMSGVEFPGMYG